MERSKWRLPHTPESCRVSRPIVLLNSKILRSKQPTILRGTSLKNPHEPLEFSFPNLDGKLISSHDVEFAHKALIVGIGGSWCPNCQDQAPFLEELSRKYHGRGLEIVELSFEEASQLQNPVRLKAVIQRYGITYPVLIVGTPDQL